MTRFPLYLRFFGFILLTLSLLMMPPALLDGISGHGNWIKLVLLAGFLFYAALLMLLASRGGPRDAERTDLARKDAVLLVLGSWVLLSLVSALPYLVTGTTESLTDAIFEGVSGITTTGATIFRAVEPISRGVLLWRAETQWLGGIGIIVLGTVIFPYLGVGGYQAFSLESSEIGDKVLPRLEQTGLLILQIYLVMTGLCALLYYLFGMTGYEAIAHAMTTVSTGGFSTSSQSIGGFHSDAIDWICIVFMMLGGIPFYLYIRAMRDRDGLGIWRKDAQVTSFLLIVLATVLLLSSWLVLKKDYSFYEALHLSLFNAVSVITTTGYANDNYLAWGAFPVMIFLYLTLLGACAGSTAGGFKTYRLVLNLKILRKQIQGIIFPHSVSFVKFNDRRVERATIDSLISFSFLWVFVLIASSVALEMTGLDFATSFSAASTALANVGPGIVDSIGPVGNFADLPGVVKWILSFDMLLGRLELFVILLAFMPSFWRI